MNGRWEVYWVDGWIYGWMDGMGDDLTEWIDNTTRECASYL